MKMEIEKFYRVGNIEFSNLKDAKKYIEINNNNSYYFGEEEKEEIALGIKSNVDVSIYAKHEFDYFKMKEIIP